MNGNRIICSVVVTEEENGWYVATDVATDVASQGKTYEEALLNLKEALELYYEDEPVVPNTRAMFTTLEVIA